MQGGKRFESVIGRMHEATRSDYQKGAIWRLKAWLQAGYKLEFEILKKGVLTKMPSFSVSRRVSYKG